MEFKTIIEKVEYIFGKDLIEYLNLKGVSEINDYSISAEVDWSFEIDAREWGIKDITAVVKKCRVYGEVEYYFDTDEECEDLQTKEIEIKYFEIKDSLKVKDNSLYPEEVEIDFKNKTLIIT